MLHPPFNSFEFYNFLHTAYNAVNICQLQSIHNDNITLLDITLQNIYLSDASETF